MTATTNIYRNNTESNRGLLGFGVEVLEGRCSFKAGFRKQNTSGAGFPSNIDTTNSSLVQLSSSHKKSSQDFGNNH
jgi:hypothetical protein